MEQKFHLFVRRHAGVGYTVSVLTHPFLTAFAEDVDDARDQIAAAAAKLLARDAQEMGRGQTWWKEMRLRRVDLTQQRPAIGRQLCRRLRRRGAAFVGHQFRDRGVGLVPDRRDHRER